ncbi:hypothetical protein EG68_01538 [Paragonimus skrjabini miyazakii]|uniref:Cationic amino acid transporter C-terminal domain-containing protein n=1 Tax=Paragonimus skrjabini miyazakii TaxID=59628 RepID=A0A8S9Z6N0_9TREM|nr:hypothetical protein EG68_01538 [Paragonimus skrjabini miyazakii]
MAAIFNLKDLVDMMSIGTLLAYSLVAVSVLILRGQNKIIGSLTKEDVGDERLEIVGDNVLRVDCSPDEIEMEHPFEVPSASGSLSSQSMKPSTPRTTCRPSTFKQYLQFCFASPSNQEGPTPMSEWISTTNTYLLLIFVALLNLGLIYFDLNTEEQGYGYLIVTCLTITISAIFIALLCTSLARQPENIAQVSFRVPGVPWLPTLSIFVNLHLMFKMSGNTWIAYTIWMILGFLIYFSYGYWHSSECKQNYTGKVLLKNKSEKQDERPPNPIRSVCTRPENMHPSVISSTCPGTVRQMC